MAARTTPSAQTATPVQQSLTGVLAGTLIRTLDGDLPVEFLTPGDRIITRAGAERLMSLSVVTRPRGEAICIRAATLGHDQPNRDLWLAPGQQLLVRDWRARALYGRDTAAIPVARLVDGEFIRRAGRRDLRLFTLRFQDDAVIWAEGLELACPVLEPIRQPA